jgi:hypothetical protein
MSDPVFVIHGVGNRDREDFANRVAALQAATGDRWDMKPVYWGDLGADDRWVALTIPSQDELSAVDRAQDWGREIRDAADRAPAPPGPYAPLAEALLQAPPLAGRGGPAVRGGVDAEAQQRAVQEGARQRLAADAPAGGVELRDGGGGRGTAVAGAQTIADAVAEEWGSTVWLRQVENPTLLAEVGSAVAGALSDSDIVVASGGVEIHGKEIRGIDVAGLVRRRLADLDRVVGAAVGAAAGRLNTFLRTEQGPAVTRFFGDVLVYQRRRAEIRQLVREVIDTVDPALGRSPDRAVCVVGHSLGGVIAVDVATTDDPLWIRSLVTFGSQSPLFHVVDPRGGQLAPFEEGHLVRLPTSLGRWTNLWEPMDLLAFVAARVFRMHDDSAPVDVPVPHLLSSGLWTHSAYWQLPQLVSAVEEAFGQAGPPG